MRRKTVSIPFTSLNEGRVSFHFDWHPEITGVSQIADIPEPLSVDAKVTVLDGGYLVNASLRGKVWLVCSRCSNEFTCDVTGDVDTFYTSDAAQCDGEDEGEVRLIDPREEALDITADANDILVLSVPAKPLCSEDCKGLCPVCGVDLNKEPCSCSRENTDPRWDTLKHITFEE